MGVPAFYRWLINKYPKAVSPALQDNLDATSPNPNGLEFDNMYLDMNGIIHPCFHPDDLTGFDATTFEEVFISVFDYIDRLFDIVRPRKLIYFAIDGVAPRAKMNQQRVRRFQSARNNQISEEEEDRLRDKYEREGKKLLPKAESQLEDSNIITPGTEFMYELSKALQGYIQLRLRDSLAWKNLKVILSDANVPGEGEHKIMSFIRSQRSLPDYDVNTRHCLYGLDADLIMLALATHELRFSILREVVLDVITVKEERPLCIPTSNQDRVDAAVKPSGSFKPFPVKKTSPYQFLNIWILREYLEFDMRASDVPDGFKFDTDRAVDDFVFLCFFVGNDFLPHLPSLDIREGALDLLMTVYKRDFKSLGGYLVDAERVNDSKKTWYLNLKRVERLVLSVASYEDQIFKKSTELRERRMNRVFRELSASRDEEANIDGGDTDITIVNVPPASLCLYSYAENDNVLENTKQLKEELSKITRDNADVFKTGLVNADRIKYGTAGWKERYYQEKFATEDHAKLASIKKAVVEEYVKGLCWVMLYYFCGVPSWTWFYPYHYGPCASDLKGLGQVRVKFQEGFPFEPFDQLMAVLPPRSADALPKAYRNLMTDESSDVASYYPRDFKVDTEGKRFLWQCQVILPFIDEKRLLASTKKANDELKDYEVERNLMKSDLLFVRASSDFGSQLLSEINGEPSNGNGVGGFLHMNLHALNPSEGEDKIVCVNFTLAKPRILVPRILEHVEFPGRTVDESDIKETVLWHEQQGGFRGHRAPNRVRHVSPPENESSGLVGGPGWKGRGGGFNSSSIPHSPNSRQGVYNHPNEARYVPPSRPYHPNSGAAYHGGASFHRPRQMPPQPGFRPRGGHLNYPTPFNPGNRPRGWNPSYYPSGVNSEGKAWTAQPITSQLQNLRVGPQVRGVGRGHGAIATDYQGSQGGIGRGQFRPYKDSREDNRAPEQARDNRW